MFDEDKRKAVQGILEEVCDDCLECYAGGCMKCAVKLFTLWLESAGKEAGS